MNPAIKKYRNNIRTLSRHKYIGKWIAGRGIRVGTMGLTRLP